VYLKCAKKMSKHLLVLLPKEMGVEKENGEGCLDENLIEE
jgi:hypothetical protein